MLIQTPSPLALSVDPAVLGASSSDGRSQFASQSRNTISSTTAKHKRPRRQSLEDDSSLPDGDAFSSPYDNARFDLICSHSTVDFTAVYDLQVEPRHCFAMGVQVRDYFGRPLVYDGLEVRLAVPPAGRHHLRMDEVTDDLIRRPIGKSFHLIVKSLPRMADPSRLETGFALLTMCKRVGPSWKALSLVSFDRPTQRPELELTGNLDRCTAEATGRRIWGQRTSHVAHEPLHESAKPFRVQSRGLSKATSERDEYCILLSLHAPDGWMLVDVEGKDCVAHSNSFAFGTSSSSPPALEHAKVMLKLADRLESLPLGDQPFLSVSTAHSSHISIDTCRALQRAAGVIVDDSSLTDTACPLSDFPWQEAAWKLRVASTSLYVGQCHAKETLRDPTQRRRFLFSRSFMATNLRYLGLVESGLDVERAWLRKHGVKLDMRVVRDRAECCHSKMEDRRYRSRWSLCVGNVYPDHVLIDRENPSLCHGLTEDGRITDLMFQDRMYPLARFAFTTKMDRSQFQELLFEPYRRGLNEGGPFEGETLQQDIERFNLLLHAIHLDYFIYWITFRNETSVKRIEARLLEEDDTVLKGAFLTVPRLLQASAELIDS